MAADVVFTNGGTWYTNSYSWRKITEYALSCVDDPAPGDHNEYLDVIGIDFPLMPDDKAAEVAKWFSRVIDRMLAEAKIGSSEEDREHVRMLISKLHSEVQTRTARGSA